MIVFLFQPEVLPLFCILERKELRLLMCVPTWYQGSDFGIDQSASPSTKQQNDETLEDIKAIAELEPNGIIFSHTCFFFFSQNCINFILLGGVLLLGRQPLVQKCLFIGKFQKSIQAHLFQTNCQLFFLYLFKRLITLLLS